MYLRFTSRTNADGSVVRYVALAHNRRVDGQTKPDVLMNLGRVEQVDVEGLRRLAAAINKHFGDVDMLGDGASARYTTYSATLRSAGASTATARKPRGASTRRCSHAKPVPHSPPRREGKSAR